MGEADMHPIYKPIDIDIDTSNTSKSSSFTGDAWGRSPKKGKPERTFVRSKNEELRAIENFVNFVKCLKSTETIKEPKT